MFNPWPWSNFQIKRKNWLSDRWCVFQWCVRFHTLTCSRFFYIVSSRESVPARLHWSKPPRFLRPVPFLWVKWRFYYTTLTPNSRYYYWRRITVSVFIGFTIWSRMVLVTEHMNIHDKTNDVKSMNKRSNYVNTRIQINEGLLRYRVRIIQYNTIKNNILYCRQYHVFKMYLYFNDSFFCNCNRRNDNDIQCPSQSSLNNWHPFICFI